jgi:hypothetical protein
MSSILYSCQILVTLEFSRQIFEKHSNIKFHENPSVGAELFNADGRTDMTYSLFAILSDFNEPQIFHADSNKT